MNKFYKEWAGKKLHSCESFLSYPGYWAGKQPQVHRRK